MRKQRQRSGKRRLLSGIHGAFLPRLPAGRRDSGTAAPGIVPRQGRGHPLTVQHPSGGRKLRGIPMSLRRKPPTARSRSNRDDCVLRTGMPPLPAEGRRQSAGCVRPSLWARPPQRNVRMLARPGKAAWRIVFRRRSPSTVTAYRPLLPAARRNTASPRTQKRSRPGRGGFTLRTLPPPQRVSPQAAVLLRHPNGDGFVLRTHPHQRGAVNCRTASSGGMKRRSGVLNGPAGSWKRPRRRYPPSAAHIWRNSMTVKAARYAAICGLRRSQFQKTQNPPSPSGRAARWYGRHGQRRC